MRRTQIWRHTVIRMQTLRRKPKQLSLTLAVAVLAIGAMVAVALMAGGTPAQATTASLTPDANEGGSAPQQTDPTPTPRHKAPEACPEEDGNTNTLETVVSSGHIALFDVYWNTEEEELTNNPCPPTVEHVPASGPTETNPAGTEASDDRTASNINIEQTIIHIPDSAKVDLSATDTPYPQGRYQRLWEADDLENPDGDGDRMVWVVPACPPDGSPGTDELCIAFSAALLNPEDWRDPDGNPTDNGNVQYHLDHVHQTDTDRQDPRYVLTYPAQQAGSTDTVVAIWDSSDAEDNTIEVEPGKYARPVWFFTSPASFEFQVHVTGHPKVQRDDGVTPVSEDESVSGDVREYLFHVGHMANLSVGVTAANADSTDSTYDPGDKVTITVTANNSGPDTAASTKVDVTLPEGLTYVAPDTANDYESYDEATRTVTWSVGDLGVTDGSDGYLTDADAQTLTIMAMVGSDAGCAELPITAEIYATETIQSTEVVELDPRTANNAATATITPVEDPNANLNFFIGRSVAENAPHDTHVGSQIFVNVPDNVGDREYSLIGEGAEKFHISLVAEDDQQVEAGGSAEAIQLKVERDAVIDHDRISKQLDLTLGVREVGDDIVRDSCHCICDDPSECWDHTIPVRIILTPDEDGFNAQAHATGPVELTDGSNQSKATFTVKALRWPSSVTTTALRITVVEEAPDGTTVDVYRDHNPWTEVTDTAEATFTWHRTHDVGSGAYKYTVDVKALEGTDTLATAAAPVFTVTW